MTEIFNFLYLGKKKKERKKTIEVSKIENCGNLKTATCSPGGPPGGQSPPGESMRPVKEKSSTEVGTSSMTPPSRTP